MATAAFGCKEYEQLPPGPGQGGGGTTMSGAGDAGSDVDGAEGTALRAGTICRLVDLRDPGDCIPTADLSGIVVSVLGSSAQDVTDVDGRFDIELPASGTAVVKAAFGVPGFEPSVVPIDLSQNPDDDLSIPVMDSIQYNSLLTALDVQLPQDTGTLVVHVTSAGFPVQNAQITEVSASFGVFYDAGGPEDWIENGLTGIFGAALVFGVNQPVAEFTAIDDTGTAVERVFNIPVGTDALTFIQVEFTD